MADHFEKAIERDLDTLIQALMSPSFKFKNISSFVESFDPILNSRDYYALHLKKLIQFAVFYYFLIMILRCSKESNILKTYPFFKFEFEEGPKLELIAVFDRFKKSLQDNESTKSILLKELTGAYRDLTYREPRIANLEHLVNIVWKYLLELSIESTSINISELYNQRVQNEPRQPRKKITDVEITDEMLESEP